jgi:hypothetical protein
MLVAVENKIELLLLKFMLEIQKFNKNQTRLQPCFSPSSSNRLAGDCNRQRMMVQCRHAKENRLLISRVSFLSLGRHWRCWRR